MSEEISVRLAQRLRQARKERSLSLEALARLSGVSRSMLSQIERAESSPTVSILWNLTRALNIDFSGLLDGAPSEQGPIREVIRADQTPIIHSQGQQCSIRILSPPESVGVTEIYDLQFGAEGVLDSEPHRRGCLESLSVIEGSLSVSSGGIGEQLEAGDTVRYAADVPHSIRAGAEAARALLVVTGS